MNEARQILNEFTVDSIPSLDVVVSGALDLFHETELPQLPRLERPLVIGSGGALVAGEVMFAHSAALFANESNYQSVLQAADSVIDGVVIVSASGSKHAAAIAQYVSTHSKVTACLITNNPSAEAAQYLSADNVYVLPKNREPYTNNVSTYLGMILATTHEDSATIQSHIEGVVAPVLQRDFAEFNSFTFILPASTNTVSKLLRIKFEEMFEPKVHGRAYGEEDIKHAKTVVSSGDELFISLGVDNQYYGDPTQRLHIPLPHDAQAGMVMAVGYYVIGAIQNAHPPYFKNSIVEYAQQASQVFNKHITPIVE